MQWARLREPSLLPKPKSVYDRYVRGECTLEQTTEEAVEYLPHSLLSNSRDEILNRKSTIVRRWGHKTVNRTYFQKGPRTDVMLSDFFQEPTGKIAPRHYPQNPVFYGRRNGAFGFQKLLRSSVPHALTV
jgi:hypothetical protein